MHQIDKQNAQKQGMLIWVSTRSAVSMLEPLPVWASWIASYRHIDTCIISTHNFGTVDIHSFHPSFL